MSQLEDALLWQMQLAKLPAPELQHRFAAPRRFRFDFAWPDRMVAVEVQGGQWVQGRHNRPAGYAKDSEKMRLAMDLGWRVYPFTGDDVKSGLALEHITRVLSEPAKENA